MRCSTALWPAIRARSSYARERGIADGSLAAQSENQDSLPAKAQAALDAKRWPEAEAALKQLLSSEPRWEYLQALATAQMNQGHYADSLESYQRAIDLAG